LHGAASLRILFADDDLEALCSSEREQKRKLGTACAKKLRTRIAELMAAKYVGDLVAGRPHPLRNDREGQFAVDLEGGRRLVVEPADVPMPLRDDSSIAWDRVTEVRVVYIGNYHD
jgi:proteic killer suppression protein